ncbi:LCP family glycopolymer transferase [Paenibacillus spongiae]|uniref:LCP family protein n=1 Tax=Paenibacillus spongiae TaxID=2909671 RepID=A0ABY5SCD0_9BACL|nr:LCP family protein [Paenibacillus spongiae]UVI31626.1 LCP family protein [Paenibacillus spongiae]
MKRPMKKILIWSSAALALIVVLSGSYVWYMYHSVEKTVAQMYEPPVKPVYVSRDPEVKSKVKTKVEEAAVQKLDNREPFNVLVLGVDQRPNDRGRSDTMIVLTVNPAKQSILMFNIPRDSRTEIIGRGSVDKINHAYAFGGVEMSLQTVENFLDYPIDYYIKVNMEGFARLIDLIGGVKVDNPFAFNYGGHEFKQGKLSLNGSEALLYSRMRFDDPKGDLGRNARQRAILQEVMKSAMNVSNVTRIQDLLNEVGDSVKTDITFEHMKKFVMEYRPAINRIDTVEIEGSGKKIGGIWYYIVTDAERTRIHNMIKDHMTTAIRT